MQPMTLLVMLIVISVSKCLAMSVDEIEEFKSYLRRTSQFDQNLKSKYTKLVLCDCNDNFTE